MRSRPGQLHSIRRKRVKASKEWLRLVESFRVRYDMEARNRQFVAIRDRTRQVVADYTKLHGSCH